MTGDWLDGVLRPRALPDDGFAERVIAVAQAQRRTKLLLRAVVLVVAVGAFAAYALGVVLTASERWDGSRSLAQRDVSWLDDERTDFQTLFAALDAHPALARRTGRDAAPTLDAVVRELREPTTDWARACRRELGIDMPVAPLAVACDTSFINGLATYDEWRRATDRHVEVARAAAATRAHEAMAALPARVAGGATRATFEEEMRERDRARNLGVDPESHFPALVRLHLARAAAIDDGGATFRAAAEGSVALGRMQLGHSFWGAMVLREVAEQTGAAGARAGGFTSPLTPTEASEAMHLWMAAQDFGSATGTSDDVAFLRAHGRSVLSCGLRSDAEGGVLETQELYVASALRERNRAWATDGCAPRPTGGEPWMVFGDEPTVRARAAALVSRLPVVRQVMAWVVTQPRSLFSIRHEER